MIITNSEDLNPNGTVHKVGNYTVYFLGFVFQLNIQSGLKSISDFLLKLDQGQDIKQIASILKGQYFIYIINDQTQRKYCFTDESGNFHSFYSDHFVSTSFIEIAKHLKFTKSDFNPSVVAEFIHWGNLHHNRTFFDRIKKIKGDEIITFNPDEKVRILLKENCSIDYPSSISSLPSYFESISRAIKHEKIVVDITGGIDSRLLVAVMSHYKLDFDLAVSGIKGNEDIRIAEQISFLLKKKLIINYHNLNDLENELNDIFYLTDGLSNVVSYHRPYQLLKQRKGGGYSLSISGAGGEIYKEFSWLHDFPFYNKKYTNLNKYYYLRFAPINPNHNLLTGDYHEASIRLKKEIIKEWEDDFLKDTNSQAYDNIYFNYKWPMFAGRFITNNSKIVSCYAPFLELELAKLTYSLPRRERAFNRWHRKWISYFSPVLSMLPTTEGGMTISNRKRVIIPDAVKYFLNRLKRLANKAGQKLLKKSIFPHQNPNHSDLINTVISLPLFSKALKHLQDEGIINTAIEPTTINGKYVGSILTLSKLIKELELR